jgi:hypothetical protein
MVIMLQNLLVLDQLQPQVRQLLQLLVLDILPLLGIHEQHLVKQILERQLELLLGQRLGQQLVLVQELLVMVEL